MNRLWERLKDWLAQRRRRRAHLQQMAWLESLRTTLGLPSESASDASRSQPPAPLSPPKDDVA
jgi:hypothetical protein